MPISDVWSLGFRRLNSVLENSLFSRFRRLNSWSQTSESAVFCLVVFLAWISNSNQIELIPFLLLSFIIGHFVKSPAFLNLGRLSSLSRTVLTGRCPLDPRDLTGQVEPRITLRRQSYLKSVQQNSLLWWFWELISLNFTHVFELEFLWLIVSTITSMICHFKI